MARKPLGVGDIGASSRGERSELPNLLEPLLIGEKCSMVSIGQGADHEVGLAVQIGRKRF